MKSKLIYIFILIIAAFVVFWLMKHAYVVIPFLLSVKVLFIGIAIGVIVFFAGGIRRRS